MNTTDTRLLEVFRPGQSVYLPGATGEILALADLFRADPARTRALKLIGCFVPGMNAIDYTSICPDSSLRTFMLPAEMREAFAAGRVEVTQQSYFGAARLFSDLTCDVALAHVAEPDDRGLCSLGIASDFAPLVWHRAATRILIVNPLMPDMARGPKLATADADLVIELESTLVVAPEQGGAADADLAARHAAMLVPDGAAIQIGVGVAPNAVWRHLQGHQRLRLVSGMASNGMRLLEQSGALAPGVDHQVGIAFGSTDFYHYLSESDLVRFATTAETHNQRLLSQVNKFHAINSALEVDLFGQVNVAHRSGKLQGGAGGAPDFVRSALHSDGGRSMVVLPATARRGTVSRIVPVLDAQSIDIPCIDIDTVVTENGVADLRFAGMDQRAQALIEIAGEAFRDELAAAWQSIRTRL